MQTTRNLAVEELHKATKELFSGEQILGFVVCSFAFFISIETSSKLRDTDRSFDKALIKYAIYLE